MEEIVEVCTGYAPRPLQMEIHQQRKRFTVLAIHRRFGKTVLAVNELIDSALNCTLHNPRLGYVCPLFKQAKAVAWQYLKDYTFMLPNVKIYESELRVDIPMGKVDGKPSVARIQLFGADNPDAMRGLYFDDVVLDEFANMPLSLWSQVLRPALSDRKGGCIFLGTPNGKNHFFKQMQEAQTKMGEGNPEWFAATYRADETKVIDPDELISAQETMDEADYRQEYLCDWSAAIKGSFFSKEMNSLRAMGHIQNVSHEPKLPVIASFDLGVDDATAVWFFQCYRTEIRVINYIEWTDVGLIQVLKDMRELPYIYAELVIPWDGNKREASSGSPTLDTIDSLGFDYVVPKRVSVKDRIEAARQILPKCWFDEIRCLQGIDALENYRKKYDHHRKIFTERPEHDEYSHGADSFTYFALAYDPYMGEMMTNARQATQNINHKPRVKRST